MSINIVAHVLKMEPVIATTKAHLKRAVVKLLAQSRDDQIMIRDELFAVRGVMLSDEH